MCNINGHLFDETRSRAALVHYDYTVLAGTQGQRNHYKQDRMFELAHRFRLPMMMFGEGGGGRPGDDYTGPRVAIDTKTFTTYAQLSGLVPMISVVNGRCFAGNTALVACSDVIIATEGSTLGMGGPAMIEGGGLGIYTPEEVGPMSFQVPNGVVDILVKDEFAAVDTVKKYLSYFQGAIPATRRTTSANCGSPCRRIACGSTTCARSCTRWRTRTSRWISARNSASASSPRSPASRAGRWA